MKKVVETQQVLNIDLMRSKNKIVRSAVYYPYNPDVPDYEPEVKHLTSTELVRLLRYLTLNNKPYKINVV